MPACLNSRHAGFIVLIGLSAACDVPVQPPSLVVGGDTIVLAAGARIHEIDLRVRPDGEFSPAMADVTPGDILRLTTGDGRGHALAFDASAGESAIAFLESSGQLRSPPLLAAGSSWIIDLTGAPGGEYRLVCLVHEDALRVRIIEP